MAVSVFSVSTLRNFPVSPNRSREFPGGAGVDALVFLVFMVMSGKV